MRYKVTIHMFIHVRYFCGFIRSDLSVKFIHVLFKVVVDVKRDYLSLSKAQD